MKKYFLILLSLITMTLSAQDSKSFYDFTMDNIEGKPVKLDSYKGKVVLVVNTASKCGLTPQYKDLEKLYQEYKAEGLVILGFPANNFMGQEPGTDAEIAEFCEKNYGVSFDMFSKISVKGKDIHPLYKYLTDKKENGVLDAKVTWNFQKFLIDKNGNLISSFSPKTTVYEAEVISEIKNQLSK